MINSRTGIRYGIKNKGKNNSGFTLVEMVVVLTIIAIMMSAAVWGVTGWIAHYEYISSEEKARTIYMAAQSALSAAESRGTLDDCMEDLRKEMVRRNSLFESSDTTGLAKSVYGIPDVTDNEGNEHCYGYLSVSCGDYEAMNGGTGNVLFDLIDTYVTDTEQLNGSIVIEFDLTAKKVYSAFYSSWASSISYDDSLNSIVRSDFYITDEHRTPEYREEYAVGYYGADQVNVVILDDSYELNVDEVVLHNEETLYLTMNSTSLSADTDTVFDIELLAEHNPSDLDNDVVSDGNSGDDYNDDNNSDGTSKQSDEKGEAVKALCSFTIDWTMLQDVNPNIPKRVELDVKDGEGKNMGRYAFILSYDIIVNDDGETKRLFNVTLDAMTTGQSMALMKVIDENGRTDSTSYSITRLLGVEPKDIFARVSVEPSDAAVIHYAAGSFVDSNVENDLYATKDADSKYVSDEHAYEISTCRHLSNIRYAEEYEINGVAHTYAVTEDIDWKNGVIYSTIQGAGDVLDDASSAISGDAGYTSLDTAVTGFPMIPKLNTKSVFDGQGRHISNLIINNSSSVIYKRNTDGTIVNAETPINSSKTLGLFGTNRGMVKRLVISAAKETAISSEEYNENSGNGGKGNASIYSDSLEAVGIICGRCEGYIREIYFDKDCSVSASVFANPDDEEEAKAEALAYDTVTESYIKDEHENQIYGCGIGMVAGTVFLNDNISFDRIRTSGKVSGWISGKDDFSIDTPEVSDSEGRKNIYNETDKVQGDYTNAQCYAYGVGGVFGYVYGGEYKENEVKSGIGVSEDEVRANSLLDSEDISGAGYLQIDLFEDWTTESIVNKADVEGRSFTGGIVGNICISGLSSNKSVEQDKDGDITIPNKKKAVAQITNCHNYGDTKGEDFVGGIVGVNGEGGYIKECVSYGSLAADGGVSAGITSENYGYIDRCFVNRAVPDEENEGKPYIPQIESNMLVAGAITSVNHEECVVYGCEIATDSTGLTDKIMITGSDMATFGYIVGDNYGVVNTGRAGRYLGYDSKKKNLVIGGAVGTNHKDGVVKNIDVNIDLDTKTAIYVGGVVGRNSGKINNCTFAGSIVKNSSSSSDAGLSFGGIAAINETEDGSGKPTISSCNIEGGVIETVGLNRSNNAENVSARISKSSAVGGICGINNEGCSIIDCYLTSAEDENGNITQTGITVSAGMAGGIAAINAGSIRHCGGKEVMAGSLYKVTDQLDESLLSDTSTPIDAGGTMASYLDAVSNAEKESDTVTVCNYTTRINSYMKAVTKRIGALSVTDAEQSAGKNAYTKEEYENSQNYINKTNTCILRMNDKEGNIGGIVGYNVYSGSVTECASGRWIIESYLTTKDSQVGGVIGENTSGGAVKANINFAYVRRELKDPYQAGTDNVKDRGAQNNHEYYIGGVIGLQNNSSTDTWKVEGCVNLGNVVNYYGDNVGGIISKWKANGGTVDHCFNYGTLMTGYQEGSNYGTAGGIVSYCYDLTPDQIINVISCQNHGIVNLAVYGIAQNGNERFDVNDSRSYMVSDRGRRIANDVGGIVGKLNAPSSAEIYTVNVKDCVNGSEAKVYSFSLTGGILGWTGGDKVNNKTTVDSLFVNVDRCRNYSSDLFSFRTEGGGILENSGRNSISGIIAERQNYSEGSENPTGYTTVTNCLTMRLTQFNNQGEFADGSTKIYAFKEGTQYERNLKYCRNNFIIDELSFHYDPYNEFLMNLPGATHFNRATAIVSTDRLTGGGEISTDGIVFNNEYINDVDLKYLHARRMHAFSFKQDGVLKHSFFLVNGSYYVGNIKDDNTWVTGVTQSGNVWKPEDDSWPMLKVWNKNKADPEDLGEVIPYIYDETGINNGGTKRTYAEESDRDIFRFRYLKENDPEFANESQLPAADIWDIDVDKLDESVMQYFDHINNGVGPDYINNVKITPDERFYDVTWDINGSSADVLPTATEFDVEIQFYKYDDTEDPHPDKPENMVYSIDKKAYGNRTTFTPPERDFNNELLDYVNNRYYVRVRVKDTRGKESDYSAPAYSDLIPKLKTPEFEIVAYNDEWVLHLLNPEDFIPYADNIEVGAYYKGEEDKVYTIDLKKDWNATDEKIGYYIGGIKTDVVDQVIYGYAKGEGYIASDLFNATVYITKDVEPAGMNIKFTEVDNELKNKSMPEYSATIKYTSNDNRKPQIFRLEMYGIKDDGNTETIAKKEYVVASGTSEQIAIGYYDVPRNIKLSDYASFGVECWYASTGQGPVYEYFTVDSARVYGDDGITKSRMSGYVRDISGGTEEYFFHKVKLYEPQIDLVGLDRDPRWAVRLLNPEAYEGADGVKINVYFNKNTDNPVVIDMDNPDLLEETIPYAINTDNFGWKDCIRAQAVGPDYRSSVINTYTTTKNGNTGFIYIPANIQYGGNTKYFDINMISLSSKQGDYYVDEQGILHYKGALTYDSKGYLKLAIMTPELQHYYRVELCAKDSDGNDVTLYMSKDILMKNNFENDNVNLVDDIEIPDTDISDYNDVHIYVWYSGYQNGDTAANCEQFIAQYYEIDKQVAEDMIDKGTFTRNKGYIKDITGGADDPHYYYVAPIADKRYGDTTNNAYKNYVLMREDDDVIVPDIMAYVDEDDISLMKWNSGAKYYDLELNYFSVDKSSGNTPESIEDIYKMGTQLGDTDYVQVDTDYYAAGLPKTFNANYRENDYYMVARVKDHKLTDDYYSDQLLVRIRYKLPKPELDLVCPDLRLNNVRWYMQLTNHEEYTDTGVIVRIKIGNKEYEINTASDTLINGVLPYAVDIERNGEVGDNITAYATYPDTDDFKSDNYIYNKNTMWLFKDFEENQDMRLHMKNLNHTADGEYWNIDYDNNSFDYKGSYKFEGRQGVSMYMMSEMYAYKNTDKEKKYPVTLYMELQDPVSTPAYTFETKDIDVQFSRSYDKDKINLSDYYDFHVSVWLAQLDINTNYNAHAEKLYFEISKEAAETMDYSRDKGIIAILEETEEGAEYKYYYVSVFGSGEKYIDLLSVIDEYDITPENSTPEDVTPGNVTLENSMPEDGTPENVTPENSIPEDVTPENDTPEGD